MNLERLYNEILPQAGAFLGVFFVVMMIGYGFLYFVDFVPEAPTEKTAAAETKTAVATTTETLATTVETAEMAPATTEYHDPLPQSITIPSLNKTISILNPTSRQVADLDAALLKGAVRHPDSADLLDTEGNMLLLGHSSYLKTVINKNFQAFNGIQNLKWGDTISVRSADTEYTYRVERVYEAPASTVTIPTKSLEPKLTLATCNTFGAKEDRFIVEATLVSKKAL